MARFKKVLWLDTETFSLDPEVASVREIAYVADINGEQVGDIQIQKVQPILHKEDQLYGHQDIQEFVSNYNKKFHPQDPDCLMTFGFKESLFFYSKTALTFNLPPPAINNPSDWLMGKGLLSAKQAVVSLFDYILKHDNIVPDRWVVAGHNVVYDFKVLTYWFSRVLGKEKATFFLDRFNKFIFLDTLALSRWMQYSSRLSSNKANLHIIAQELGLDISETHTANADVFLCRKIARILLGME